MDKFIVILIQSIFLKHQLIRKVIGFIAKFGYWLYILYGLVEWIRPGTRRQQLRRRHTLVYCIAAVIFSSLISCIVGGIWKRERPFIKHKHTIQGAIPHEANASFPSNHSMNSMAASLMLLSRRNLWGIPFLFWSLVLGASRIICGLHYFTDVLGGFVIGMGGTFFVRRSRRIQKAGKYIVWYVHVASDITRQWLKKY
jgi:undecaprenyl-diphosphatase